MSDPTPLRTVGTLAKSRFRPWLTWVALATIWCAVLLDQTWVFALLLTAWVIYDLRTGESLFIQRITRREQPVTYWIILLSWIAFAVLWLVYPR